MHEAGMGCLRRRLGEWRRDVRYAMYNKRVRIATEMFSELFGADFDSIIPIYPTGGLQGRGTRLGCGVACLLAGRACW